MIHHAPWSRWLKTFYLKGQYAYEIQFGPLIVQWFYKKFEGRHLRFGKDPYWRR